MQPVTRPSDDEAGTDSDGSDQDDDSTRQEHVLVDRRFLVASDDGTLRFDPGEQPVYHDRYRSTTPVCNHGENYVPVPRTALPERATRCQRCDGEYAQLMGIGETGRRLLEMDPDDLPTGGDES